MLKGFEALDLFNDQWWLINKANITDLLKDCKFESLKTIFFGDVGPESQNAFKKVLGVLPKYVSICDNKNLDDVSIDDEVLDKMDDQIEEDIEVKSDQLMGMFNQ